MGASQPRRGSPSRAVRHLFVSVALLAVTWAVSSSGRCRLLQARPAVLHAVSAPLVLPTEFGSVYRYSIPGEWKKGPGLSDPGPRAGVLHVYLKALRWPMGDGTYNLRARGFLAFEFTTVPAHWETRFTFHNVPEVASRLRLYVHSVSQDAYREVSVELAYDPCEREAADPEYDYQACVARSRNNTNKQYYNLADIDLDFGPVESVLPDFELMVLGWPRRASLEAQLAAALRAPPARLAAGPPAVYRALPCVHGIHADKAARILLWSDEYHAALGFAGTLLYVRAKDVPEMEAHPGIRALVAAQRLTMVLWEQFAEVKWWRDFDLQIVQAHSMLSFWGSSARVLVVDADEFFVPGIEGDTLSSMMAPGGCLAALPLPECAIIQRRDIFPAQQQQQQQQQQRDDADEDSGAPAVPAAPAVLDEPNLWGNASDLDGPHPLTKYGLVAGELLPTKLLLDPSKAMSPNIHLTSACTGSSEVIEMARKSKLGSACAERAPCSWVGEDCAWLAHVGNMHKARKEADRGATQVHPPGWLWMLGRA